MIGSTVDKYEVLQKVGEGGMATVYRGRHTTLDRDVAIKVLHPHLSSSTRNRKRFAREARAIEHLRHANILEIFDYSGIDSGECYIITEFVEGHTLTAIAEDDSPLPSELAARIGIKLCRALGYAHAAGILHRDLKPDNVMIRNDGTVKLMDFGIARFLDESQVTLTGALVGSPAFMSPEQAVEGELGIRSDLFSLGTVLFYLVSGELPFSGTNPSVILKKVIEGDRPSVSELVPTVSPTLADVIERLMATHPDGRFNTAAEVSSALAASLEEVGIRLDDEQWALTAWLADSQGYRERLEQHVSEKMLAVGKEHLSNGDNLGALRLFNRLLALDDGNQEVLELIQGLHTETDRPEVRRALPYGIGLAALVLLLGGILAFFVLPKPQVQKTDPPLPVVKDVSPAAPAMAPVPPAAPSAKPEAPAPVAPQPEAVPEAPKPRPAALKPVPPRPQMVTPTVRETLEAQNEAPATLRLRSTLPADVYHKGKKLGSTRQSISLAPGSYLLELKGDMLITQQVKVEVSAGEVHTKEVQVQAKPATIRLSDELSGTCTVALDGTMMGSVESLNRELIVPRPDQPGHTVRIECENQEPYRKVFSGVVLPQTVVGP